jgi:16S rRNA (cytosine1402-N4)-methyltransferase
MSGPAAMNGRWDSAYHAPVLAAETLDLLGEARVALDCTLGGGGHALAMLEAGVERVTAIDRDPEAIASARARLAAFETAGRLTIVQGNYADAASLPGVADEQFDAIVADLGISSHQVDDAARGFSFREGAPLDMRMGPDSGQTAADLLNELDEGELRDVFREYGDEPRAGRLAREVVRRRGNRPFVTSDDFVGAIRAVLGPRSAGGDFARLFQSLRIAVNDELAGVARALPALRDRLRPAGVMAVIAYHSGEDRLVKHAFRDWSRACTCPPVQPMCTCGGTPQGTLLTRRAIVPSDAEQQRNPRSRSARLRAWRRAG